MVEILKDRIFEDIIETMREAVLVLDSDLNILFANRSFYDSFKVVPEETVGSFIYALGNRQWDIPKLRDLLDEILPKDNKFNNYEVEHEFVNIGHKVMLLNARRLIEEESDSHKILLAIEDITERRQLESTLKDSEERFRRLFETANDGILLLEKGEFKIRNANPAITALLGYSNEEFVGSALKDVGFPEDMSPFQKILQTLETDSIYYYRDALLKKKGGQDVDTDIYMVDKASLVQCNIRDITERKQSEEALQESEEKFRNFTEQSFVGFYIIQDDVFKYVNPKFADIFGYTVYECMEGMRFRQLVHTEDLASVQEQVRRRVAGEIDAVQHTFRGVKKSGEVIHVSIYGSSLMYKGRPAAIGTMLDITKDLEMEKRLAQSQRMESIGNLAGGIAHDFNNILFPIIGLSELLLEDLPPGSLEYENTQQILKAGERGSDLVQQILAFSRQSEQKKMPIRIQQILKEVMKLTRSTIPANISITQYIQNNCGLVMAESTHIHQIAMNLITNAYHAVEPKSGEIAVRLKEVEVGHDELPDGDLLPGRYVLLTVSDTGGGIDPAIMDKIFEPYFTTKAQGKGTGLGLAVVYGIVKDHLGDIKVYSELGRGTTFKVYLPIMAKAENSESIDEKEEYPPGNERILLVDDEAPIANLEKQMLERLGYRIVEYVSSSDALKAFKANPSAFDLVISDMAMPNMTGDQLARKLLKIRPDIPIIICTGFSEQLDRKNATAIGLKGFLMKPITKSEMAKVVRKILDEHKSKTQE